MLVQSKPNKILNTVAYIVEYIKAELGQRIV